MVEAGGIEPCPADLRDDANPGQNPTNAGPSASQAGHPQKDTAVPTDKGRTETGPGGASPGPAGSAIYAQQEHNNRITGKPEISRDLQDVLAAWPHLPAAIKTGILAMIRAVK